MTATGAPDPYNILELHVEFPISVGAAMICHVSTSTNDDSGIRLIELSPAEPLHDYRQAMILADRVAAEQLGEHMLLSWYDRDRDFESPQHASECHAESAIPGYVDYGVNHGATLKVDIEQGRYVFFYLPIDLSG